MKHLNLYEENDFSEKAFKKLLVHDSPYFKIINFNFKAGQELPVHSHDIEGQLSLVSCREKESFWERTMPRCRPKQAMSSSAKLRNLTASEPGRT